MSEASENNQNVKLTEKVSALSRMLVKSFNYAEADPDTFLQNARRTTETICKFIYNKEVGEETKKMMLSDYGRALLKEKVIPERMGILIGTIQTYGNYGAHAQEAFSEASREWIAPCQTALANLTNWFFLEYLQGEVPNELKTPLNTFADNDAIPTAPNSSGSKKKTYAIFAGIVVLLLISAVLIFRFVLNNEPSTGLTDSKDSQGASEQVTTQPVADIIPAGNVIEKSPDAKRIAILYFDNSGEEAELNKLRKGLTDMLITDLSKFYMLQVIERDKLEEILKEQDLSNSDRFDESTATQLGKLLGVECILAGSYFELFGSFRIDARLIDVETGKILKSEGIDGSSNDLFALEKQLVGKIISGLEVSVSDEEKELMNKPATNTLDVQTGVIFSSGLDYMDKGDNAKAIELFQQVLETNPEFEPAQKAMESLNV